MAQVCAPSASTVHCRASSYAPSLIQTGASSIRLLMLHNSRAVRPFVPAQSVSSRRGRIALSRRVAVAAAAGGKTETDTHLQLATALLPKDVNADTFIGRLYQWAATVTSSGNNMPLALPLRVTRTQEGFEMSMLRMRGTKPVSVADITATVEPVSGKGQVLFLRLFDAEGSDLVIGQRESNPTARVKALSQALVDVAAICNSMPPAIRLAVVQSRN